MHIGNRQWLDAMQRKYGHLYADGSVLEIGALDWNGSVRRSIHAAKYVGIDSLEGPGVDIVVPAIATSFRPNSFDLIVCTSMLEHDPMWPRSLNANLLALNPGGLLFLSWGAEGNQRHLPEPWAFVPVGDVLAWAIEMRLEVLDALWEKTLYHPDCVGCYNMVLRTRAR